MRFKVGTREKPLAKRGGSIEAATALATAAGGSFKSGPTFVQELKCNEEGCGTEFEMSWQEDSMTGEVFFECPDECSGCGHKREINPADLQLGQDDIVELLGK